MSAPLCRICASPLELTFVDLGMSPPCESYLTAEQVDLPEVFLPLHVRICESCLLVQLPAYVAPEAIFTEYAYFSSYSDSWVRHAEQLVDGLVAELRLGPDSFVVEVASNDGYLLQHVLSRGIPCLGVEPAANVAAAARDRGITTETCFLTRTSGEKIADVYRPADLVVANNVFAHVPDIVDFAQGLRALVADTGVVVLEFPHLLRLIEGKQYDTIYHEHYSYLTLRTAMAALARAGLAVSDVVEIPSHGGSLRVFARPDDRVDRHTERVEDVLALEGRWALDRVEGHLGFADVVNGVKRDLVRFLLDAQQQGLRVAGYGAPGKGNTLLNHCGVRSDLVRYTVDRNPYKHGRYLPGTHIPIHDPAMLAMDRPDLILILPWNLQREIASQLAYTRQWGARLVVPIPELRVL